jgi:hypothetical protein
MIRDKFDPCLKMLLKNKNLHGWVIKYLIIHFIFPDENEMPMTIEDFKLRNF